MKAVVTFVPGAEHWLFTPRTIAAVDLLAVALHPAPVALCCLATVPAVFGRTTMADLIHSGAIVLTEDHPALMSHLDVEHRALQAALSSALNRLESVGA